MNNNKQRDTGVDILRSIGMIYIIGYWHIFNYTDPFPAYFNFFTDLLTRIILAFLVLMSGYYAGKGFNIKNSFWDFYRKKVIRIYPLYFLALVIFFFIGINGTNGTLTGALLISMFIKPVPWTLWFITMLMVFYIATPIIQHCLHRYKLSVLIYTSIFVCSLLLFYGIVTNQLDVRLIMYFPAYLIGIIVANRKLHHFYKYKYMFAIIAFIIIIVMPLDVTNNYLKALIIIPFITIIAFILMLWSRSIDIQSSFFIKYATMLSYSTFCMYLFHRPVYELLMYIYRPTQLIWQLSYLVLIGVPLTIVLSYYIQKSYDVFMNKLGKTNN